MNEGMHPERRRRRLAQSPAGHEGLSANFPTCFAPRRPRIGPKLEWGRGRRGPFPLGGSPAGPLWPAARWRARPGQSPDGASWGRQRSHAPGRAAPRGAAAAALGGPPLEAGARPPPQRLLERQQRQIRRRGLCRSSLYQRLSGYLLPALRATLGCWGPRDLHSSHGGQRGLPGLLRNSRSLQALGVQPPLCPLWTCPVLGEDPAVHSLLAGFRVPAGTRLLLYFYPHCRKPGTLLETTSLCLLQSNHCGTSDRRSQVSTTWERQLGGCRCSTWTQLGSLLAWPSLPRACPSPLSGALTPGRAFAENPGRAGGCDGLAFPPPHPSPRCEDAGFLTRHFRRQKRPSSSCSGTTLQSQSALLTSKGLERRGELPASITVWDFQAQEEDFGRQDPDSDGCRSQDTYFPPTLPLAMVSGCGAGSPQIHI